MVYARWATNDELKGKLVPINLKSDIKKSGIPMMSEGDNIYIDDSERHSIVIGSMGSGRVQSIILPQIRLAIKAGESVIVNDFKGYISNTLEGDAKDNGYNVIKLNMANPNLGNSFNPFTIPYELYKKGDKDEAIELIERVSRYIYFSDNPNVDPFWDNMASNYFTGIALYLFENNLEDDMNLNGIYKYSTEIDMLKEYIEKQGKTSTIYTLLGNTLNAPSETRASIISVFNQKLSLYVTKEKLSKLLSTTDFDVNNLRKEKTIIFIISDGKNYETNLLSLIIDELVYVSNLDDKSKRLNIILDEFQNFAPIYDFSNMLVSSRYQNIRFTICIKSMLDLNNLYGKDSTMKMAFGNIIYLLASDVETLEEISNLCGKKSESEPLISIEELKLLDEFEAVILMPRISPIRTKLVPYYKLNK